MGFHWCGNPFHDVPYNFFVILALMPEYLPLLGAVAIKAKQILKQDHHSDETKKLEIEEIHWS